MNFQVYYNNGTIVRVDYNIIDGAGNTIPMSKYFSLSLQQEIDPNTTILSIDIPQPFQQTNEICCPSIYEPCYNTRCGLVKAFDNNWVVENVLLFDKNLSVYLEYLKINGEVVLSNQSLFVPYADLSTYVDDNGLTIYSNVFDWLSPLFAQFGITLQLDSITYNSELLEVLTLNYNSCDIQSYEFKLKAGDGDQVNFEEYIANETGYVEVEGLTSDFILFYFKRMKDCISIEDYQDDP